MNEQLTAVVADLNNFKEFEGPIYRDLREKGLSFDAQNVIRKLSGANILDGWHRVYEFVSDEMLLKDALCDQELKDRGYVATEDKVTFSGASPAGRDVVIRHTTTNTEFGDLWVGESLT